MSLCWESESYSQSMMPGDLLDPVLHKKQEGLDQRNAETKSLVHVLQSFSCIDLSHMSWRELQLCPEHYSVNCADQECEQERLGRHAPKTRICLPSRVLTTVRVVSVKRNSQVTSLLI